MITFLGVNMSVAVWQALSACSCSASWLPLYHLTSTCLQLLPVSKLICPPVFKSPVSTAVRLEKKMKGEGNLHIHDVISIFPDNLQINPSNFILMQTLRPRNEAIPYSAKISQVFNFAAPISRISRISRIFNRSRESKIFDAWTTVFTRSDCKRFHHR